MKIYVEKQIGVRLRDMEKGKPFIFADDCVSTGIFIIINADTFLQTTFVGSYLVAKIANCTSDSKISSQTLGTVRECDDGTRVFPVELVEAPRMRVVC